MISRRTVGRRINDNYNKVSNYLKLFFQTHSEIRVCTTADIWSTKHRSFIGITAHWVKLIILQPVAAIDYKAKYTYF